MLIADARFSAIRDFWDGVRGGWLVCREMSGLLEWVVLLGDRREAALRCARMPIAAALFSAILDFWAGVRGGGLVCWEGFEVLVQVLLLLFWEEGSRLGAGAVVVVDAIRDFWAGGREGGFVTW